MATKFKQDQAVRQMMPAPIEGRVVKFGFDEKTGDISYLVGWTDAEGVAHERYFTEDQIEAT